MTKPAGAPRSSALGLVLLDPGLISAQLGAEVAAVQPPPHGLQRPSKAAGPQGTHQPPRKTKHFCLSVPSVAQERSSRFRGLQGPLKATGSQGTHQPPRKKTKQIAP